MSAVEEPVLTLVSAGLMSRFGFGDGDVPEWLLDHCDAQNVTYPVDWRRALCRLVRAHLLPALSEHHDVEVVELGCSHNPIRAVWVDGVDVTPFWSSGGGPVLTPESVWVPYPTVVAVCGLRGPGSVAQGPH